MPLPDKIANAPMLEWGLEYYYEAFMELSTCRGDGGPIPWSAIRQYAAVEGRSRDDEEFARFLAVIRGLDLEYLEYQEEQRKKNAPKGKSA